MSSGTVAHEILWPADSRILIRVVFLYVGQGSSIVVIVRNAGSYETLLVDTNLDTEAGGIDVPRLVKDLLPDGRLHAFVNTHPHDDHLHGVREIAEAVTVENVWHSGHVPSKKYGNYHPDLKALIEDVRKRNGDEAVVEIDGSRSPRPLFDGEVHFLAPAEHLRDEVNEADAETRYRRIHENCAVMRFGAASSHVLITGDADLVAFRDNITPYHKERLAAHLLDASHHGSRSFFMESEGDDPYLTALRAIAPEYVIISAPTAQESRHSHPHDDAVKLYVDQVGEKQVLHTGQERETFFFDFHEDGARRGPQTDEGRLAAEYGLDKDDDGGGIGGGSRKSAVVGPFVRPSQPGEYRPRKYALEGSSVFYKSTRCRHPRTAPSGI